MNKVPLTSSLWLFAIHIKNSEIIHHLEENHVKPINNYYGECLKESIKCHHIELTNYIKDNLFEYEKHDLFSFFSDCFQYHNFLSIIDQFYTTANQSKDYESYETIIFNQACKFDHFEIIEFLLKSNIFERNEKKIKTSK